MAKKLLDEIDSAGMPATDQHAREERMAAEEKPADQPAASNGVPPVATGDEMHTAGVLLRRFRNQMKELPTPWQKWLAESLVAGVK